MKLFKYVLKGISTLFLFAFIFACQEDFSEVGTDIVGQVNFDTREVDDLSVTAFSRSFSQGVQTNALPVGALGFYRDNVYGTTNARVLTQLMISRDNPDFGDNTVIDSVILTLPYFSTILDTDADGNSTFELDSIFGGGPMRLTGFRSDFFLNDLDPDSGFEDPAIYTSDQLEGFSGIEGDILFDIQNFVPDDRQIVLTAFQEPGDSDSGEAVSRIPPALRIPLDNDYWEQEILNREGDDVLLNQNSFNNFFRGLYLRIEPVSGNGNYILFDYSEADITIFYNFEGIDDSTPAGEADDQFGDIMFNLTGGVQLVGYQNDFNTNIIQDIANADDVNGEENLYLKGGDGSIALIDLFGPDLDGNGVADQLEVLRECNIIINEANLTFFVDQEEIAAGSGEDEPERIFIYNFENSSILLDALSDLTSGTEGAVSTRTNHLGRLVREEENDISSPGVSYRIRITRHLDNIINRDSTNARLALAVSQNVLIPSTSIIGGTEDLEQIERLPITSVISPEGTILHGNLSDNNEKRLRLRLFYTLTEDIDPNSPCGQLLGIE